MGLFDLFKGKNKQVLRTEPGRRQERGSPRQGGGRQARAKLRSHRSHRGLARIQNAESAAALLKRFTFHIDPSITDQEEKDAALRGILGAGEAAIVPIRTFCVKAESLTWPLKILKDLGAVRPLRRRGHSPARIVRHRIHPQRRSQAAAHRRARALHDPRIRRRSSDSWKMPATTFDSSRSPPSSPRKTRRSAGPLARALAQEESVRVKNRLVEGLVARGWAIPEELRDEGARAACPRRSAVAADGTVKKR